MKKNHFLLGIAVIVLLAFVACNSRMGNTQGEGLVNDSGTVQYEKGSLPVIHFETDFHDFGKLVAGEKVTFAFRFTNTGKAPLLISNVMTSCGCTVSDYPKRPIKPGEKAAIDISFDSTGKHGLQTKTITVIANTDSQATTLRIQSQVSEPEDI